MEDEESANLNAVAEGLPSFENEEEDESFGSNIYDTPGGTRYWSPQVDTQLIPVLGSLYGSIEDCITMYQCYAEASGFDIRRGSEKRLKKDKSVVLWKYVLCSRAGNPVHEEYTNKVNGSSTRRSRVKVTGCLAQVRFKLLMKQNQYQLQYFECHHNHPLVDEENRDFLRSRRKLDFSDLRFMDKANRSNLGSGRSHKLRTFMRGGYRNAKGKVIDWKNLRRNYTKVVGPIDGQLIIDKLNIRKQYSPNFSFEFEQDGRKVCSLFWADETAKLNYSEFGDTISFDATFRTNKYNMVFVPFTGIDNHQKSVTFGAGLLSSETLVSYKWLLEAFVRAHAKHPQIVLSDQDSALGQAIALVFTNSRHRLCMWHIMTKVATKIGYPILNTTDFRERLNHLVWNCYITVEEFEEQWAVLLAEFNLEDHGWLNSMYEIRDKWISDYFRGVQMSGLMKTTSQSESANSFFNTFLSDGDTFMGFLQCYESAMEKQRYIQRSNDHDSCTMKPVLITRSPLEVHAYEVYTDDVFKKVQRKINNAAWNCNVTSTVVELETHIISMIDSDVDGNIKGVFKVVVNKISGEMLCTCNYFIHYGIPCSHMFRACMNLKMKLIPKACILRRWRKDLIHPRVLRQLCSDADEEVERASATAHTIVDDCVEVIRSDQSRLDAFVLSLQKLKALVLDEPGNTPARSQEEMIFDLIGVPRPESIQFDVPAGVRNKGTGRGNRRVGTLEKVTVKAKTMRQCQNCKQWSHDTRTCPQKRKVT